MTEQIDGSPIARTFYSHNGYFCAETEDHRYWIDNWERDSGYHEWMEVPSSAIFYND